MLFMTFSYNNNNNNNQFCRVMTSSSGFSKAVIHLVWRVVFCTRIVADVVIFFLRSIEGFINNYVFVFCLFVSVLAYFKLQLLL